MFHTMRHCERLQLFDTDMLYRPTVLYCGDTRLASELHSPGFFEVDFCIIIEVKYYKSLYFYVEICTLNCMLMFSCIVLDSLYHGVARSSLLAPKRLHYSAFSPVRFHNKYDLIYLLATK